MTLLSFFIVVVIAFFFGAAFDALGLLSFMRRICRNPDEEELIKYRAGIQSLKDQISIQSSPGNYDYDNYMLGLANGLICAMSNFTGRSPDYLSAPDKWTKSDGIIEDTRPEKVIYADENHCILAINEVGPGGALHEYHVATDPYNDKEYLTSIFFQEGPIQENGVNGCQNEDLLRIVIDRLKAFQAGPFPCEENADALAHCMDAIIALDSRTANRRLSGVEGRSEV